MKNTLLFAGIVCLAAVFAAASPGAARAGSYPDKNVTIVIPFEAGGTTDIGFRVFAKHLQKNVPVNLTILNIQGAGGTIGSREVMKKPADGYTLLVQTGSFPMNYAIGTSDYTYEDFAPVSMIFSPYNALCVRADSKYKTYQDFVDAVKTNEKFRYGVYTNSPMTGMLLVFEDFLGVRFRNIVDLPPTKSTELLAGRIDAYADSFASMKPYIDSGEFRCLAVFTDQRLPRYPDIPTFREFGYDYVVTEQCFGLWAPRGTPKEVVEYLNAAIAKTCESAELAEELDKLCYVVRYEPTDRYVDWLSRIYPAWLKFADAFTK